MARERFRFTVKPHFARAPVDFQPAKPEYVAHGATFAAPQDGSQPRKQLAWLEGLWQIVIGAHLQADDAIHGIAPSRQHQYWNTGSGPDPAAHLEAVHVGQHQVQDDRIESLAGLQGETGRAVLGPFDAKSRPAEIVTDHLGKAGIVFDQQNAFGHPRILAPAPALPEVPALPEFCQAIINLAPLFRRQDFGGVTQSLRKALARSVGKRDLLGPKCLDGGAVDRGLCQQNPAALPRVNGLLSHGQKVLYEALDDGTQLFLLLRRPIDLNHEMPDRTVGSVLGSDWFERPMHEAGAVPVMLADGARSGSARQRGCQSNGDNE
jgi:hypothetical protein